MPNEIELWRFVHALLLSGEAAVLLVVAESSGSSPGRAGYKMAVASGGEMIGSIGGGVMEVGLVERARAILSEPGAVATGSDAVEIIEQVHQKLSPDASGMICSGRQAVILELLTPTDLHTVNAIIDVMDRQVPAAFEISNSRFQIIESTADNSRRYFSQASASSLVYQEKLGTATELIIIGGGHCALALSEVVSRLDFRIRIFDDRPELNTIEKNHFADEITIIDGYDKIGDQIGSGEDKYVVVMTLGYASDAVVIRTLTGHRFNYFGVLGSRAKMATLVRELLAEGVDAAFLNRLKTPVGLPINSRTPEEIAVSIAAEMISVRNERQNRER